MVTPPAPPQVIHAAGDAHPGEANPAAAVTRPDGLPAVSTAEFLAMREAAEEAIQGSGGPVYADQTSSTRPAGAGLGGPNIEPEGYARPIETLDAPNTYMPIGASDAGTSVTDARVEVKNEANREEIQRNETQSGRDDVERLEYRQAQTNEVREDAS